MKRFVKKALVAASIAAVALQSVPVASACGGSGRGRYAPVYGSYPRAASNYRSTLPVTPPLTYTNPNCHQPVVGQPIRTVGPNQPLSAAAVQPRPRAQVAAATAASVAAQTAPVQQTAVQQTPAQQTAATNVESSALAALASITSQNTAQVNTQAAAATQTTTPARVAVPKPQPVAATTPAAAHVGSFQAKIQNNVTVELKLTQNGAFSWIVRSNGKTTQFSGQYRVSDGRLTLVRSNDLQQMAGKLTRSDNGFTFKLDGTGNAGLNFMRV